MLDNLVNFNREGTRHGQERSSRLLCDSKGQNYFASVVLGRFPHEKWTCKSKHVSNQFDMQPRSHSIKD